MNIVIFGANGQTGRLLTRTALVSGHRVVAATRRPDDFPLSESDLTVAAVDVRDAAAVTEVVHGADVVLSTLGVSFTREPVDTYSVGTGNIVAAMGGSGSRRLVVVSSTAAYPMRRSRSPLGCGYSSRLSSGRSERPCMKTCAEWRASCAAAAWTGRSCGLRDCSTYPAPPTTTPEKSIPSARSLRGSIWPTTYWPWPATGRRSAKPWSSRPPNTHRRCGK